MIFKIENYLVNTDEIRSISLWYKDEDSFNEFKETESLKVDDEHYFCLVIDFKTKISDDDFEEIGIPVDNAASAYYYLNNLLRGINGQMSVKTNEPESLF